MRKIPVIMASQHPDNVSAPYFGDAPFISTYQEPEECYRCFHDLGCDEYMWDWEGKLVDEAVVDRLIRNYHSFFAKKQLGRDVFLTYRIPNNSHEPGYRLGRAYMGILTAEEFVHELKLHTPPILEVILPMTESATQLMHIQETFQKTARWKTEVFEQKRANEQIGVIPLFEGVDNLLSAEKIIKDYVAKYQKFFGNKPDYLRPFVARSDPALNSGLIATVLAVKSALSDFSSLSGRLGIPLFPIIGPGGLPFRGHLTPMNTRRFMDEYAGVRTVLVQSSFRYDWELSQVKKAISLLKKEVPKREAMVLSSKDRAKIEQIIRISEGYYRTSVEKLASVINEVSEDVPSRRERMLHIGLLGYSRTVGKKKLPRAIKFTSALYSLGIPPELIGTGRALRDMKKAGLLDAFNACYLNFEHDIKTAGYYLNKENLHFLVNDRKMWWEIEQDVRLIEEYFGWELGPRSLDHYFHRNSTSNIYFLRQDNKPLGKEIEWAAKWRKSLG